MLINIFNNIKNQENQRKLDIYNDLIKKTSRKKRNIIKQELNNYKNKKIINFSENTNKNNANISMLLNALTHEKEKNVLIKYQVNHLSNNRKNIVNSIDKTFKNEVFQQNLLMKKKFPKTIFLIIK